MFGFVKEKDFNDLLTKTIRMHQEVGTLNTKLHELKTNISIEAVV